jgi:6-phosphogluconolactonase (cycloisomerase 2 family)
VHADLDEVSAYATDRQSGTITLLNRQSCGGKNPVHLSIDPTDGRWIVTANYSAGSVGVVPIEEDGSLGSRSELIDLPGEPGRIASSRRARIPAPRARSGRLLHGRADKGLDRVFRLDAASGKLKRTIRLSRLPAQAPAQDTDAIVPFGINQGNGMPT